MRGSALWMWAGAWSRRVLHAYSSWRTVGEIEGKLKRGRGGCTLWAHEERRWVERVVETRRGRGWRWSMYLPSFLRTPCLRVSFSQCRKPTYRPLRLSILVLLLPLPFVPRPPLPVPLPVSTTFTAPPLWSVKLFGRDRRLVISWPRLSSSGLVLTRRHSTRRIHWIRIVVEMLQILGSNLCDGLVRDAVRVERSTALYIN